MSGGLVAMGVVCLVIVPVAGVSVGDPKDAVFSEPEGVLRFQRESTI